MMSFVGAGFLGFAHTLPQVNLYTHGTLVTAMHGHMAFWGAYAMMCSAIITYAMPLLTGRKLYASPASYYAFWASNIGMVAMTLAFAVAGVTQVYLERRIGMDFLAVQKEIEVHFWGLILAALLFTSGIVAFIWNFIRYGLPVARVASASSSGRRARSRHDAACDGLTGWTHRATVRHGGRLLPARRRRSARSSSTPTQCTLPLLLKGPTGCGKSRFVEAMAARVGRPLVTVACNDETSAADLLGRWLVTRRRHRLAGRAGDARRADRAPSSTWTRSPRRARTSSWSCIRFPTIAAGSTSTATTRSCRPRRAS